MANDINIPCYRNPKHLAVLHLHDNWSHSCLVCRGETGISGKGTPASYRESLKNVLPPDIIVIHKEQPA